MKLRVGDFYVGEFKNEQFHGKGTYICKNGGIYEGYFAVSYTHLTLPTNREV